MCKKKLKKYLPLLRLLIRKRLPREYFTAVIQSLDDETIRFICECVQNTISLQYVSRLDARKRRFFLKKITPNRKILQGLCKKEKSYKNHRKIIVQKGYGFLIPIISAVIPLIVSLLSKK